MSHTSELTNSKASFSAASIIAVLAAILSFASGAIVGMFFALVAIVAGVIGIVIAVTPQKRGGIASSLAILGGAFGIVAALFKALFWIF